MNLLVKVCGMTRAENIRAVEALGIDLMGFIFYPKSPRFLYTIPEYLPRHARRVGVFVNEDKANIRMYADRFDLDAIQLHGNESPAYCRSLRNEYRPSRPSKAMCIIKAFSVAHPKDFLALSDYEGICDYFLFDTPTSGHGGSGNQFDWELLEYYDGSTPFFLSGGINRYSVRALQEFRHPRWAGIDLNSRFETAPGIKDPERIREFLEALSSTSLHHLPNP